MKRKMRKAISMVLVIIFALCLFAVPNPGTVKSLAAGESYKSRLGANIEGLCDWSRTNMFVDAMKTSRAWGSVSQPWSKISQVDSAGWPTTDAGVVVFTDCIVDGVVYNNIAGTYKLSFVGQATIASSSCSFSVANQVYQSGITKADIIVPSGQSQLMMTFSGTTNGVRNVVLTRPGYPAGTTQVFTNEFLASIESFGTIRFMDYLDTNGQEDTGVLTSREWSTRRLPTDASQAGEITGRQDGGCYEHVIQLANLTGKDVWVNVPSNASDNYVLQMATFLRDNLNSGIKIYVEYSNEVWNWQFAQAQNNNTRAQTDPDANGSYLKMYAKKVYQVSQLYKQVFGSAAMNDKVRVTLAWQFGWNPPDYQPREMLNFLNTLYGTPSNYIYSLSIAPYFSEPLPENSTSISAVHSYMTQSSNNSVPAKNLFLNLSREWGLIGGVNCYEGGPHHQGQVDTNLNIRMAAHRDSGMTAVLTRDLKDNWFDLGGGLFMYFTLCSGYGKYGSWGLTEKISDTNTAKFLAIKNLAAITTTATPAVTPTKTPTSAPTVTPTLAPTTSPGSGGTLVYEGFNYSPGAIDNLNGGTNWSGGWDVQNNNTGYVVGSSGSLAYQNVVTVGNYATGAYQYQSMGRMMNASSTSPDIIKPYLNATNKFGKAGTTLYLSSLMRIDNLSDTSYICFSPEGTAWVPPSDSTSSIYIGVFGSNSLVAGKYYWTLKIKGQYYVSNKQITQGATNALVTKMAFTSTGGTVSLFVNPTPGTEPSSANAQCVLNSGAFNLQSICIYGGNSSPACAIDEIRLATSFAASLAVPVSTPTPTLTPTPAPTQAALVSEGFSYASGPIDNLNGGVNWSGGWDVQNNNTGYVVGNQGSLSYPSVITAGNYTQGASAYQTMGRLMNVSSSSPANILPYLNPSYKFGKAGTTLYLSSLMRINNVSDTSYICFSPESTSWVPPSDSSNGIYIGVFGNNSLKTGKYYWTMKIKGVYYLTNKEVQLNTTCALATKMQFTSTGGTVSLFVNPNVYTEPATADASNVVTTPFNLQSICIYGGSANPACAIDEIRLAGTYSSCFAK